jgi:CRISPR system Cascade subunit CasE
MFLHRLHLNLRCKEVRRDLANPYELHSTLCRAFVEPDRKCPQGEFLWRLEPETDSAGCPRVLAQSRSLPDWSRIAVQGWFAQAPDPPIDLTAKLNLDSLRTGQAFRFRLRANPCVCRQGKRLGLLRAEEQEAWLDRKGQVQHGFSLPHLASFGLERSSPGRIDVRILQEQMLRGSRRDGSNICVFSVLYDGILTVTDPVQFRLTLLGGRNKEGDLEKQITMGVGQGKAMGLGLLSVVPVL